jgi:predicted GIY-YIG superfamily endonuclease
VLTAFDDEILYIGLTEDLHRRFFQHRDKQEKRAPTSKGVAFWFYYMVCHEQEIARIERSWLNQYQELHGELPPLNKIQSPVS